jgi:NAD(P)H-hydrate epimerase
MENAGAGAARIALEAVPAGLVLCVCGPGGNGGDAMVVARHLAVAGLDVEVVRVGPDPRGDAAVQLAICDAMGLRARRFLDSTDSLVRGARPALVVDGIYGTGLTRAPEDAAAALIDAINSVGAPVLALDLPSGLDCDTGEPLGLCVRAAITATFVAAKKGFANPASRTYTGDVRVVGIGAPADWPLGA